MEKIINIAEKFSPTPGPRKKEDGPFSAEEFRETILKPAFEEAEKAKDYLTIDFDGGYGYFDSFLEEAFGGLAREKGSEAVEKVLKFKSDDDPDLIQDVRGYIENANAKK
jgi:hypothetical protein